MIRPRPIEPEYFHCTPARALLRWREGRISSFDMVVLIALVESARSGYETAMTVKALVAYLGTCRSQVSASMGRLEAAELIAFDGPDRCRRVFFLWRRVGDDRGPEAEASRPTGRAHARPVGAAPVGREAARCARPDGRPNRGEKTERKKTVPCPLIATAGAPEGAGTGRDGVSPTRDPGSPPAEAPGDAPPPPAPPIEAPGLSDAEVREREELVGDVEARIAAAPGFAADPRQASRMRLYRAAAAELARHRAGLPRAAEPPPPVASTRPAAPALAPYDGRRVRSFARPPDPAIAGPLRRLEGATSAGAREAALGEFVAAAQALFGDAKPATARCWAAGARAAPPGELADALEAASGADRPARYLSAAMRRIRREARGKTAGPGIPNPAVGCPGPGGDVPPRGTGLV